MAGNLRTEEMVLNMGPQHPSTHGVLRLQLVTDGEIVSEAEPHIGYLHRCAEKIGENVNYQQFVPYTDRMDYLAGMNCNHAYAHAVERLMGLQVPERAEYIRILVLELNRIAADTGITFESITPQTAVPISGYQAVPINLTFKGNFYNLSDFLYRLRTLVVVNEGRLAATGRLFAIDTLDFAESQEGFPRIAATLVVDAFVYGTGVAATATPAPTSTTATMVPKNRCCSADGPVKLPSAKCRKPSSTVTSAEMAVAPHRYGEAASR